MSIHLETPVEYLKGVGAKRAEILKKETNIFTVEDLLQYFPYKYIDKSNFYSIASLRDFVNTYVQIKGQITAFHIAGSGKGRRLTAHFQDNTASIQLVWFNNLKYIEEMLRKNTTYIVFGKPTLFNNAMNITHPEMRTEQDENEYSATPFQPVYNTTEKMKRSGLDSKGVSRCTYQLLLEVKDNIPENLPNYMLEKLRLIDRKSAFIHIHFPQTQSLLKQAIDRLKFEEMFFMQLSILQFRQKNNQTSNGFLMPKVGAKFNEFYKHYLPFPLTDAQKRVIKEIRNDFVSGRQMNRLLQGDVGSGKTITAVLLMLIAIDNGFQCCLMSPTEILAVQHYTGICKLLANTDVPVALLTGSTKTSQRKILLPEIENGTIKIVVGTHALTEDKVVFDKLGFVVIDEQHRFGVEQRARLWKKSLSPPHVLVMTATPIPRTLAMTLYGDLDMSVIDELPKGRKPVVTQHYYQKDRPKIVRFLKEEIRKGRQVYVVYPLIEESETLDFSNLMEGYDSFKIDFPEPDYKISCVHGKLSSDEKEVEMQRFIRNETQLMLATTVIEVGIDVPNASVMVIENAERFGLSQLHQLRGRVGRGNEQSYCILLSDVKLSSDSKKRIQAMVETNNGFEIADFDLKLRGPGDLSGTKQSGTLDLKLINIVADEKIIATSRNIAQIILADDPALSKPENTLLKDYLEYLRKTKQKNYYRIG
ncbi:MAG: ATP-dependent DNA helicase RecG [Bacteroidales bacterium]|jgi:ATP-dependent DNA helicase RecG|nr:ATP-dependent DNA helicase RecG [Bacteroidales bacterium]